MTRNHRSKAATMERAAQTRRQQGGRARSEARNLGREARTSAGGAVDKLKAQGEDALEEGRETLARAAKGFDHYVAENPFKAVLVAASAGALLGFALRRRS